MHTHAHADAPETTVNDWMLRLDFGLAQQVQPAPVSMATQGFICLP